MTDNLEKIRSLVETPCLVYLQKELERLKANELADDIAKLVSQEPTGYITYSTPPPPGYESHGPIRLGFSLAVFTQGYVQKVPVASEEESHAVNSRRAYLLARAMDWYGAFTAGSPELTRQCHEIITGTASNNTIDDTNDTDSSAGAPNHKILTLKPVPAGLVLNESSPIMLGVAVFLIKPDGAFAYLPQEKIK